MSDIRTARWTVTGSSLFVCGLILAGCAGSVAPDQPIANAMPISSTGGPMSAPGKLDFFDSDAFDSSLGQALADRPAVVHVAFVAPTSINAIPPRINTWLTEVKKSDGQVKMAPADPSAGPDGHGVRGIGVGIIFDLIDAVVSYQERQAKAREFAGSHAYDATVVYDKSTGAAKEIVFERR